MLHDLADGAFLVGHLQRLAELRGEPVAARLLGQLPLEAHALGRVACVEHDAPQVAVAAQVGHAGVEVAPLAAGAGDAEAEPRGLRACARPRRRARDRPRARRPSRPSPSRLLAAAAEMCGQRLADVAAAVLVHDRHEVGRGLRERAEARRLAARDDDQRAGQQQRQQQAAERQADLRVEKAFDAAVGFGGERARDVERDGRGERGETRSALRSGSPLGAAARPRCAARSARLPPASTASPPPLEVGDQLHLLFQLGAQRADRRPRGTRGRVVVAVDIAGAVPPSSSARAAFGERRRRRRRGRRCSPARTSSTSFR